LGTGDGSNFLNLKFLNFWGIRNGRKFAADLCARLEPIVARGDSLLSQVRRRNRRRVPFLLELDDP